jgi:hypothetical protein
MMTTGLTSVPAVAADGKVLGLVSRSDEVTVLARADQDLERDVRAAMAAVGLHDWLVELNGGTVELVAPARAVGDRGLARVAAGTIRRRDCPRLPVWLRGEKCDGRADGSSRLRA